MDQPRPSLHQPLCTMLINDRRPYQIFAGLKTLALRLKRLQQDDGTGRKGEYIGPQFDTLSVPRLSPPPYVVENGYAMVCSHVDSYSSTIVTTLNNTKMIIQTPRRCMPNVTQQTPQIKQAPHQSQPCASWHASLPHPA